MQQKPEFITRQIRKLAREIGALADDIDNHHLRAKFYIDLLKNKIFELYEANNQLTDAITGNESFQSAKLNPEHRFEVTPKEKPEPEHLEIIPDLKVNEVLTQEIIPDMKEESVVEESEQENNSEETDHNKSEEMSLITSSEENEKIAENEIRQENHFEEIEKADINKTVHAEPHIEENDEVKNAGLETATVKPFAINLFSNELKETGNAQKITDKKEDTWLFKNLLNVLDNKQKSNDIAERKQDLPVSSLNNAISISMKHEFISTLFAGDSTALKDSIQKIESMNSFDEAIIWMEKELTDQYNWKKNEKLSFEFTNLVRRRFL